MYVLCVPSYMPHLKVKTCTHIVRTINYSEACCYNNNDDYQHNVMLNVLSEPEYLYDAVNSRARCILVEIYGNLPFSRKIHFVELLCYITLLLNTWSSLILACLKISNVVTLLIIAII